MSTSTESGVETTHKKVTILEGATVRFAGDSGDGMQLAGTQLTNTSALAGNDVATFPDFPAEIRARAEHSQASAAFKCTLLRPISSRQETTWTRLSR